MQSGFADVVEEVKKLTSTEKEELQFLIHQYLTEEKRNMIYNDYEKSVWEFRENTLQFSSDIQQLKEMIE